MPAQTVRAPSHVLISGLPAAGAVGCPSAQVGDRVLGVINITGGANVAAAYESVISVAGQIQQLSITGGTAAQFAAAQYWVVLAPVF